MQMCAKVQVFMFTRSLHQQKIIFPPLSPFSAHFLLLYNQNKQIIMITKDSIQEAYAFFHQKWRIYSQSTNGRQKDDIEYAISDYARNMNTELYQLLAHNRDGFLFTHTTFAADISFAVDKLEQML
jgi:hypothetical protein